MTGVQTCALPILEFVLATTLRKRLLVNLPFPLAKLMGALTGWLPTPPLTMDQVELLKSDNVVSLDAQNEKRDLPGLGIMPRSFRTIVPTYLYRFRKEGQFTISSGTPQ